MPRKPCGSVVSEERIQRCDSADGASSLHEGVVRRTRGPAPAAACCVLIFAKRIHQPGALSTSSRQVAVRCNPLYRLRHNGVRSREWGVYGRSSSCGPALPGPVGPLMDMGAGPALPRPDMNVLDSLRGLTRSAAPRSMSPTGAQAAGAAERRASYRGPGREESPIRPLCAGSAPSGPCWDRSPPCGGVS